MPDKFFAETWVKAPWVFIDRVFHGLYAKFVVDVCVQAGHIKGVYIVLSGTVFGK